MTTVLRPIRWSIRKDLIRYAVIIVIIAASPLGASLARVWQSTPQLTGLQGGLVLTAAAYLGRWVTPRISGLPRLPLWADRIMAWLNKLFSRPTPLLLLVVFHRAGEPVTVAACVLGAVMTAITAHNVYVLRAPQQRLGETSYAVVALPSMPAPQRADILRDWLHHAVLRRPRRPDLQLIFGICGWAQQTSASRPWSGQSLPTRRKLLPRWQQLVEELLNLVETEGIARIRGRRRLAFEQAVWSARTQFILTKSMIFENEDRREESAETMREMVRLAECSDDPNEVVVIEAAIAGYQGTRLGLTEEAMRKLAALLERDDLSAETRSMVLVQAIPVAAMRADGRRSTTIAAIDCGGGSLGRH